ncbi:ArsR/SmtB family transcription factor [Kribbella sp. DT2]|uniref:ArsR/SmtB family transcription factor n=1 Tax=Kribbella sp. DT2 TaxID=3393427 RepID=UPI003CEBD225
MTGTLRLRFPAGEPETRFVLSPLWETLASVRVLQDEAGRAAYPEWADWALRRVRRHRRRLSLLFGLVRPALPYVPGFLFVPPSTPVPDLTADLVGLRGTSPEQVRQDLDLLAWVLATRGEAGVPAGPAPGRGPLPDPLDHLYDDPAAGLIELGHQIELYWKAALAPRWGRIRAVLTDDLTERGRTAGDRPLAEHPGVRWDGRSLLVEHTGPSTSRDTGGAELLMMPSAFAWSGPWPVAVPPDQPRLTYPALGAESLWTATNSGPADGPADGLAGVLGASRAKLLSELAVPASTSDLAARTGITAGGASQHLAVLKSAGLVSAHRAGHSVLYARTATAETLLRTSRG